MAYNWTTEWPGVYAKHESNCPLRNGGDCTCEHVTYRASAKAPDGHSRLLSPEFDSAIEARDWLRDQRARLTAATAVAEEGPTVSMVIKDFLAAAERGEARDRSGNPYAPQQLSQVRAALTYVESEIGPSPLQAVRRRHVQGVIDELHAAGLPSQRIVEVVSSFRDVFVYAIQRDLVDFNPIVQLRLPAEDGQRPQTPQVTTAPYAVGEQSANGNGRYATATQAPAPQAPVVPEPVAAAAPVTAADEPFPDEPTYGPGMDVPVVEPAPVPQSPPVPEQWAPVVPPPMASPPAPTTPGYPYDPAPMFATQPTQPTQPTRMITPVGAETHYGTPTYGAESVATQPTVQAPPQNAQDGVFMSEQMFWWITRIVVIVFVLIALVLAAESV
jgi:hypothetical protein